MTQFHLSADFIDRLGWVLVHSIWQFAFIALAAMVLERVMCRCSSAARYWALLVALGAMLAAPVATWLVASTEAAGQSDVSGINRSEVGQNADGAKAGTARLTITAAPPLQSTPGSVAEPPAAAATPVESAKRDDRTPTAGTYSIPAWWSWIEQGLRPWLNLLVVAWCVGVFAFALRPILSWCRVRRLRTIGVSAAPDAIQQVLERTMQRLGLRQAVQLLQSTLVQTAVVVGYFRPVVLLPVSVVTGLPAAHLEAILAHELAHIRRHDYLVNLMQTLVETIFFYHPAIWWLSHQIRTERENCCDDIAVAVLGNRVEYGRALLALEECRGGETALALGAQGGSLLARVRRLLGRVPPGRTFSGGSIVGLGLLAAATIAIGVWAANGLGESDPGALAKEPAQVKKEEVIFRAPDSATLAVALTAEGKLLARAGGDKTIDLWDVASGKKLHTLKGHTEPLYNLAFSPDGKTLASVAGSWAPGDRAEVKLWDVATGKETVPVKGHRLAVQSMAFSADGKTLATSTDSPATVKLWDVATGKEKMELGVFALSLAFSPDGKTLAMGVGGLMVQTAKYPGSVQLWDLTTGKKRASMPGNRNGDFIVGFTPDGKTLVSASGTVDYEKGQRLPCQLKLWDAATAKERATIVIPGLTSTQSFPLAFTADGNTLISAIFHEKEKERGLAVHHWDLASGKARATFWAPFNAGSSNVALSADGKTVAWGGTEENDKKITGTAHVWEVGSLATSPPKLSENPKNIDLEGAKKAEGDKKPEAAADPWVPLFNGKDLKGWSVEGDNPEAWRVEGDELLVDAAKGGRRYSWLLTEKAYSEFLLRFEYQLSEKATSGVAVWATRYEKVHPEGPNHLQVKLMDDPNYPNIRWPTGAIFWNVDGGSHIGPDRNAKLEPVGSWNRMEIEARAQTLRISVNGVEVHSIGPDKLAEESGAYAGLKRRTGHVGFGKGVGVARFRKIEIKELKPADAPQDKKLKANVKEPAKQEVKEPAAKQIADGWVALFNHKDLTGWKTHPAAPGDWRVEDGILIGRGPKVSHLYTERGAYEDLHFRIEAKINAGGNSGQSFRKQFSAKIGGDGYEAQIDSSSHKAKTGSLYIHLSPAVAIEQVLVPVDTWFTQEVIIRANHIVILVNGQKAVDFIDKNNNYARGHLALQVYDPATVVQFRKIEIKELK